MCPQPRGSGPAVLALMITPSIRYARTRDGVSIAYQVFGAGPPLVVTPVTPWSHLQQAWQIPLFRDWFALLAQHVQCIHFDGRGTGLSDRAAADFSLDAQVCDLATVVDHLGLERFALLGAGSGSPAALAYAGTFPGRVAHLFIWCGYARLGHSPAVRALDALAAHDWRAYTEVVARAGYDWAADTTARQHAAYLRACVDQDTVVRNLPVLRGLDATGALPRITAPTLVMARPDLPHYRVSVARRLVEGIANAQLRLFDGRSFMPSSGDGEAVLAAMHAFMAEPAPATARPRSRPADARLTSREREVLRLLAQGRSARAVAAELSISLSTAQRHIANLYTKIGARGRVEAAAYAYTHGLASLPHE
jgi:pimeloyl-ACP methyl ester carboxylesterase/DNA-binding CsgD family transcriptional regulator